MDDFNALFLFPKLSVEQAKADSVVEQLHMNAALYKVQVAKEIRKMDSDDHKALLSFDAYLQIADNIIAGRPMYQGVNQGNGNGGSKNRQHRRPAKNNGGH